MTAREVAPPPLHWQPWRNLLEPTIRRGCGAPTSSIDWWRRNCDQEEIASMSTAISTECWDLIEAVVPHCPRVLLYGPPGTGKTTAAIEAGNPETVAKITLHDEMSAAELQGHFIPAGDEFKWHNGVGTNAWLRGSRLVLDEIDKASGDVKTLLYGLLDDASVAQWELASGEIVRPSENFTVVATMNGHPKSLPPALLDRFDVGIEVPTVNPTAVETLPPHLVQIAKRTIYTDDASKRIGLRAWKSYAALHPKVGFEVAAKAVFGDQATEISEALEVASSEVV